MPDLGRYSVEVLLAYGGSLAMLAGLIWITLWQGRRVARQLDEIEAQRRRPKAM